MADGRSCELRPDRARRHRPVGARRHVRPRAPGHRWRPAGPDGARLRPDRRRRDGDRGARGGGARAAAPSSTRCPATPAATSASWPSCRGGPASTSSPRPGSTTTASTGRPTGATGSDVEDLAELFVLDITDGHRRARLLGARRPADRRIGPASSRSPAATAGHRHAIGACSRPPPQAHRATGAPILTHCEARHRRARAGPACSRDAGVDPAHIVLSHVDKVVDRGYHREMLATGAFVEYDGSFRWGDGPNGTIQLLGWMAEDGLLDRIVLGMDAARQGYYSVYGGSPGPGLAARRLHRGDGGGRARCRGPAPAVRRQSGAGVRLRGASMEDEP